MKLGIKIAPGRERYADVERTRAEFCEVWYNANKPDDYADLFSYLKKRAPQSGLHFWGALSDGHLTTLAYPDSKILKESVDLIKQTIDIAARNRFSYVNIHPGTRALVRMDFTTQSFTVMTQAKPISECQPVFLEHAQKVSEYAENRGVVLTIESVPPKTANEWLTTGKRDNLIDLGELPLRTLLQAIDNGAWFANDFGHTAANVSSQDPKDIWTMLYDVSKTYASQTKLIHIGFLAPPYNGADFHDHMDNPLLTTSQAVPNNTQLIELFELFRDRDDVSALVEPKSDHVKNFFLAQGILEAASV